MYFFTSLLIVGPSKINRTSCAKHSANGFLRDDRHSLLLTNSNVSQSRLKQFRHTCELQQTSDVIMHPLMEELFALLERDLEGRSIRKISELISSRNKSEKDVAKKVSITIMRFPR